MNYIVNYSTLLTRLSTTLFITSLLLMVVACGGPSTKAKKQNAHFVSNEGTNTNNDFKKIALKSSIDRVQPMTGIAFWADNIYALKSLDDIVQLEYSYMLYSDVVSHEGIYKWDVVDNILNDIESRGHQAILRFRYTYPGKTAVSVPAYIEASPDFNSTITSVEGKSTYIPDWSYIGLENFTLNFFSAFAKRYNNDPRIAFLQVGFGSYGEYHLYDGPVNLGSNFPSKAFQTTFLNHLHNEFTELHWSISIDAGDSNYTPLKENEQLLPLKFGLFDDSFMHETHSNNNQEYNRANWLFFGEHRYKETPAGGEFSYYSNYDQMNVLNVNTGAHGKDFEYFSNLYHISYIIGNDQMAYQTSSRIKEAAMATGYKFDIIDFKASDTSTMVTIKNTGVAPIYYHAYITVNNIRAKESLKGLLPNESMEVIVNSGGSSPQLTIESDRLVANQVIQFNANIN